MVRISGTFENSDISNTFCWRRRAQKSDRREGEASDGARKAGSGRKREEDGVGVFSVLGTSDTSREGIPVTCDINT